MKYKETLLLYGMIRVTTAKHIAKTSRYNLTSES